MEIAGRDAISVNVGGKLRTLREERGLSIRALARASGISANALSVIERGKSSPSVSTLYKVTDALRQITSGTDVTTKELFKLFPKGPAKKVSKISGLGKPEGCI